MQHIPVSGIALSTNQKEVRDSEEKRRKKEPNPEQQIKYIEKKYH